MNILHITAILPSPLKWIGPENDILLRIAEEYERKYPADKHYFLFVVPYANKVFALVKPKWKEYYSLIQRKQYFISDREIEVIGLPGFRGDLRLRKFLTWLGYYMNKRRMDQIIQAVKPDLCHAHNMMNNMELAEIFKARYHCDFVLTARNVNKYSLERIKNGHIHPRKLMSINLVTKRRCDKILGDRTLMIPHPVGSGFFVDENPVMDTLDKPGQTPLSLVSVCKLIKLKNLDKVIEAISTIHEDLNYTIIGDGPEKNNLMKLAENLGLKNRVRFEGHSSHDRLQNELKKYDLFIMPSFPETLGRVYFEAMASGIPVIASKGCGIDGIIEHGKHGFLTDPHQPSEIASAIQNYMQMPPESKARMKQHALLLAREFTWGKILTKYYQFYHDTMSDSEPHPQSS